MKIVRKFVWLLLTLGLLALTVQTASPIALGLAAVSYTHLTLPTILRV
mgnify:CR=1 FL=1